MGKSRRPGGGSWGVGFYVLVGVRLDKSEKEGGFKRG